VKREGVNVYTITSTAQPWYVWTIHLFILETTMPIVTQSVWNHTPQLSQPVPLFPCDR